MKSRKNKIITAAGLWLFMTVVGVNAQQSFNPSWSSYVGGDNLSDGACAVAMDSQTNVYMGGFLSQLTIDNNSGISVTEPPYTYDLGGNDGFVAKLTGSGALAWFICLGDGNGDDLVTGLAVHTNGIGYAAGIYDRIDADDSGTDAALTSFACASGHVNWAVSLGNLNGTNGFNAVAVDSNGYVYAVGYTTVTNLPNPVAGYSANGATYGHALKGSTDAVVMKFAPGNGSVAWTCYLGGTNADTATAVAVAADGSVYVGGQTRSPGWVTVPSGSPSPSNPDGFIVKLTAAGAHVWSTFLGGSGADAVSAIMKDPASSALFLGGSTASSDFLPGATNLNSRGGGTDGFVVKLTDTGATFQTNWCRFFGGSAADLVTSLTPQPNGAVMAGGTTASGSWLTQAGASTFHGVQDGFLSLLSSGGAVVWSSYVGGARSEELHAVASVSTTVLAVGTTFSPSWVSGGFWTDWSKAPNFDGVIDYNANLSYGFVAKWSSEPGVPPTITADPADVTVHEGESAAFSVTATGYSPLVYKWLRNGAPVTGFTSTNTYVLASAARTNNSDTYACLVSNYFGTATSRAAKLTVISNGTLTVTLAPAAAIAQGAKWSMNSGATWFASGGGTNLWPGAYTVTFTNLTGWAAPATLASVQVPTGATVSVTGVYTAVLPSAARSVTGTNVTVVVRAPAGLVTWTLVETLAAGLTPTSYTSGGAWNSGAHTLTFTGAEATTNTLSYTVSCVTSGVYTVSGTVTPQPSNVPIAVTGDSQITKANFVRRISGKTVSITVNQPLSNVRWTVYEYLPEGLSPTNITGPGVETYYDPTEIDWSKRGTGETVTYQVTGAPGTYTLSGEGLIVTTSEPIFGDTVLIIPSAYIPPPDILSFVPVAGLNAYNLTFTSVVSQAYMILTNATLHATNAWANCLPVTGQNGTTLQQVPASGPRLFYRVRVQP